MDICEDSGLVKNYGFKDFKIMFPRQIEDFEIEDITKHVIDLKKLGFSKEQKETIASQYINHHNKQQEQLSYQYRLTANKYSSGKHGLFALDNIAKFNKSLQDAIDRDLVLTNQKMIEDYVNQGLKPVFITYTLKSEFNHKDYSNLKKEIVKQKSIFQERIKSVKKICKGVKTIHSFELTKKFNTHAHILFFVPEDVFEKFLNNTLTHNQKNKYIGETDISFVNIDDQNFAKEILFKGDKATWNVGNQTWIVPNTNTSLQITNTEKDVKEIIKGRSKLSKVSRIARYIFKYLSKDEPAPLFLKKKIYNVDLSNKLLANRITPKLIHKFFSYNLIPVDFQKTNDNGFLEDIKVFNVSDTRFKIDFKLKFQEMVNLEKHIDLNSFVQRANDLNDYFYDEDIPFTDVDKGSYLEAVLPFTNNTPIGNNSWHLVLTELPLTFKETSKEKILNINGFEHVVSKNPMVKLSDEDVIGFDFEDLTNIEADLISSKTVGYDITEQNKGLNKAFFYNKNFVPSDSSIDSKSYIDEENLLVSDFTNHNLLSDRDFNLFHQFTGIVYKNFSEYILKRKILDIWRNDNSTIFITKDNARVFEINKIIGAEFDKLNKATSNKFMKPVIFSKNIPEQNIVKSKIYYVKDISNLIDNRFKVLLIDEAGNMSFCDKYILRLNSCRTAFAITINNSQGRSINSVCFVQMTADYVDYSHFYTAISRSRKSFKYLISEEVYSRIVITAKGSTLSFNENNKSFSYCNNNPKLGKLVSDKSFNAFTKTTGIFSLNKQDAINFGFGFTDITNASFKGVIDKVNLKFQSLTPNSLMRFKNDFYTDLSDEQKVLCQSILDTSVSVIRGDGGTGKTRTIKYLIDHLTNFCSIDKENIKVVAFTNSAVDVLKEHIEEVHLSTIHKFLGMGGNGKPSKSFDGDFIVVDETSMISLDLFYHLVAGLKSHQRIVFLGDHKQLPPVNTFSIFSYLNPTFTLTHNFRADVSTGSIENNVLEAIQQVINLKDTGITFDNDVNYYHPVLNYFESMFSDAIDNQKVV